MKRSLITALAFGLFGVVGLVGCDKQESSVEAEKTVTTPGGSTSVETETTISKEGDNPPAAGTVVPPDPGANP